LTFSSLPVLTMSAPQTVTLTNSGNAALAISGIAASGDFAQTNTCGSSIGAGSSCTINVTFTPTAVGQRSSSLTITDNAANSPHTVSLTGTGLPAGTPAGTYQIGVAGAAGTLLQTASIALVVQ
jgi:hypothetical protein